METPEITDPSKDPKRKAKSNDPGWKYAYWPDLADKNAVKCILCSKVIKGGIKRLKQHLVGGYGDVGKCSKTTTQIANEMAAAITSNKRNKPVLLDDYDDVDQEVEEMDACSRVRSSTPSSGGSVPTPSSGTAAKKLKKTIPQHRGPMDAHVRRTPEEVVAERKRKGPAQTTLENRMRAPEERDKVISHIADWFYECGIPFNAVKARSFEIMVESIGQYGQGLKPPTYHEIRVPLLDKAKEKTDHLKKEHEASWKIHGCTLMSDGWTDKRGRHLINFLVNSPKGSYFMGSVDASSQVQDAKMLFELLDSKIEEIGPEYVVQVVTDNAANYKAAGRLLMEKRPTMTWTPCAAHCLDLMLEEIGNLKENKGTIAKAKRITNFIYRHARLLDAMRQRTNGKDLVRPAVTRFATSFLTLQSLLKHQDPLKQLFVSDDWRTSKLASTEAGKNIADTVLSTTFWNGVQDCIRGSLPLLIVLRIVDGDEKPAMPEVYAAMEEAKEKIKINFSGKERLYQKVIDIVERRWACQMEQKLYSTSLFLNPGKYFDFVEKNPSSALNINIAFSEVLERLVPDEDMFQKIQMQAMSYKRVRDGFENANCVKMRKVMNPTDWWGQYGGYAGIELTNFALKLLGFCCSSSGCERNWSTFEFIHTKKRNRLEHKRLNDLVYIQYNRRLEARFKQRREEGRNYNPLVLDEFDWSSEWMTEEVENDLVHPEDGADGLRWRDVDMALGASNALQGRTSRRTQAVGSSRASGSSSAVYSRGVRQVIGVGSESDDEREEEEPILVDDLDVDDDFGERPRDPPQTQNTSSDRDVNLLDGFDD